ncbi:cellulose synthase-like protein E6 isoform X3 [Phoenix dactylifera]|uniref:Cellulose synthase-like protein E6 isoform X3 n=1 Tax=Phoenix dactylifera TaxID=42345 RepID=A0A8B7D1T9_PHODC|nr:cellulose synthase-like protein E6 isoform X3 [Phoenix dactylifera]
MGGEDESPLFETKGEKGRIWYKLYAFSVFVGLCLIWVYRASHIPKLGEEGRWIWLGLFGAELWFGFYWVLNQSVRWNPVYRRTFKERLSKRYQAKLPNVDAFVCTADPMIEPPAMVISTVLSVMAYEYPPEKLSVYLSDDAGSELTFYALLEASRFAKSWIPFCKKFKVEPRSPDAYFNGECMCPKDGLQAVEWGKIKSLYTEMENRINDAVKFGKVSENIRKQHRGFLEWNRATTSRDHQAILHILIDGRDTNAIDDEGFTLPTLVYMAREKRPYRHHNFKAGAMNSLVRVSSEISSGAVMLNVDCDMYSSNSETVKDALCFLMDEEKGHEIAYVQLPQLFNNITKNDIYGSSPMWAWKDFHGLDGYGGPLYVGSGCFHRRESLCGKHFNETCKAALRANERNMEASASTLEERAKSLITCTYEDNTEWGKEMGLKYGCPVEDVITGLAIKCRGWKSIYFNPSRAGFLGVAPVTLAQTLVQHKRWSEGDFQIFLSKYCPFLYGKGKLKLGLQMGYSIYCLWAPCSFPTLYYVIIPPFTLLHGISLFPKASGIWFMPFSYVIAATTMFSLWEAFLFGCTMKRWWNEQRMYLFKRLASYPFAFVDTIFRHLGLNKSTFIITAKVADEEVSKRYKQEMMEFGSPSPMFTILATLAMLNLVCLIGGAKRLVLGEGIGLLGSMLLQFVLCASVVLINMPVYQAMFFRNDGGRMPTSITLTSVALAISLLFVFLSLLLSVWSAAGIRFVIDREECFSHSVPYEGDTVLVSFVVIKAERSWHYGDEGVDFVVKGPHGDQIHDARDKTSEKFEFIVQQKGLHRFCFTNRSPYHETIDFDIHVGHFTHFDQHAKDEHFAPLLEQISKLEEALYNIQFEQHWLEAQTDRQALVNEGMSRRAMHKALLESAALIGVSMLQIFLLRRLFERKLGMSRV